MSEEQRTAEALENIGAEILAAEAADKEAIVKIGQSLEELLASSQPQCELARQALTVALEVLRAVYEDNIRDADAATSLLAEAVIAAADCWGARQSTDGQGTLRRAVDALSGLLNSQVAADHDPHPAGEAANATDAGPAPDPKPETPDAGATKIADEDIPQAVNLPQDLDHDLLSEFAAESLDHIAAAEGSLLNLENDPEQSEEINKVFRAFHTIKGTSGFFGLDAIKHLAHLAEELLDRAREGKIAVTGGYADLALNACDALKAMIEQLPWAKPGSSLPLPEGYEGLIRALADPHSGDIGAEGEDDQMRVGDILVATGRANRESVESAAGAQGPRRIGETLVKTGLASARDVAKALRIQRRAGGRAVGEATIRVGTDRLDSLVDMVGELVIAQSMIAQDPTVSNGARARLAGNISRAGKIVRELQNLTMSLRMVPLGGTFQKMARLVRDLARKADKSVNFAADGGETEIDRNMVEVLSDPLVHMIRNAVDHGIETAEQRKAAGKEPSGTITLRAFQLAGNVVIELYDDGKGLDSQKIRAKAVQRGLIDPDRGLSEKETFELIFRPGFSTAAEVTEVSGRGVGLDVVRKGVEALHGRIEVTSQPGRGSKFTLRLPLTMAIADAMLLRVGRERYLLPTISIEHTFRPPAGSVSTVFGRGELVTLRGEAVPVFRLHELFGIDGAAADPYQALIIVIEDAARRCALMVDELLGQHQVVIKSLGQHLGKIPGVSGGSILGDGRVGLILDPAGIIKLATGEKTKRVA